MKEGLDIRLLIYDMSIDVPLINRANNRMKFYKNQAFLQHGSNSHCETYCGFVCSTNVQKRNPLKMGIAA
jgi:hypothetical protein